MAANDPLRDQIRAEQEDLLATVALVVDSPLIDRVWGRLVDLLVEGLFVDLRTEYLVGTLDRVAYVAALDDLAIRCHRVGLLPFPSLRTRS
ncbi:MAG: hypothetical protein H0V33_01275 [Acidimicrobiia bacterium]|jgi:hypothetical protein|nr:hypothetical protein [Acidimicrobiia bacterium]